MKWLKTILGLLMLLVIVALIAAAIVPKDFQVKRTSVMDAPVATVFEQVNTMKNWESWSAWAAMDPDMKTTYSGPAKGQGASYAWEGPVTGKGDLTIVKSVAHSAIKTELNFDGQGQGFGSWQFADKGNQTEVVWTFDVPMKWPFNLMGLLMEGQLGPQMEKGLNAMKENVN